MASSGPGRPSDRQPSLFSAPKGIDLTAHKTIRLAVSGDVGFNRLETALIDLPDFQRLRRIRQLGTAYLVYPTALHTRFDHSLGVVAMADRMMRSIRENRRSSAEERRIDPEEEQLARLLALLHDLGHVPFGHTIEDECHLMARHDRDPKRIARFIGEDSPAGRLIRERLGHEMHARLIRLMTARGEELQSLGDDLFIYDLIDNTASADLLDYLKRDAYFCNLSLDLDYRFLRYLYLASDGGVRRAAVRLWKEDSPSPRRDVLTELIRLLDNRYLMSERVYFHHAKIVSGAMVAAAVQRAMQAGELSEEELFEIGDETLLDRLAGANDAATRRLGRALRDRRLWKTVLEFNRAALEAELARSSPGSMLARLTKEGWDRPELRLSEEDRAAKKLGAEAGDVLFFCPHPAMQMKLAETIVYWNGELKPLNRCGDDPLVGDKLSLILRSHQNLWSLRVFVKPELMGKADLSAILGAAEPAQSPAGKG